jgi:hypothetical protein
MRDEEWKKNGFFFIPHPSSLIPLRMPAETLVGH